MSMSDIPMDGFLRAMYRAFSEENYAAGWMKIPDDPETFERVMRRFGIWMGEELGEGNELFAPSDERDDLPHLRYAWEIRQRAEAAGRALPRPAGIPDCYCRGFSLWGSDCYAGGSSGSGAKAEYDFHITYPDAEHRGEVVVAWPVSCRAYFVCGAKDRIVLLGYPLHVLQLIADAGYSTRGAA